jgi:hypothetical protein
MNRPSRRHGVLLAVAGLLLTTACSNDQPGEKETPLETRSKADVEAVARNHADTVAAVAGGPLESWRTSTAACEGRHGETADDGRWDLNGSAHIRLPADKHVAALRTVHDRWQTEKWEISDYRTLSDGVRGTLSGRDPQTGFTVTLSSSKPPVQIAVAIGSPCYQSVQGEDPANG